MDLNNHGLIFSELHSRREAYGAVLKSIEIGHILTTSDAFYLMQTLANLIAVLEIRFGPAQTITRAQVNSACDLVLKIGQCALTLSPYRCTHDDREILITAGRWGFLFDLVESKSTLDASNMLALMTSIHASESTSTLCRVISIATNRIPLREPTEQELREYKELVFSKLSGAQKASINTLLAYERRDVDQQVAKMLQNNADYMVAKDATEEEALQMQRARRLALEKAEDDREVAREREKSLEQEIEERRERRRAQMEEEDRAQAVAREERKTADRIKQEERNKAAEKEREDRQKAARERLAELDRAARAAKALRPAERRDIVFKPVSAPPPRQVNRSAEDYEVYDYNAIQRNNNRTPGKAPSAAKKNARPTVFSTK